MGLAPLERAVIGPTEGEWDILKIKSLPECPAVSRQGASRSGHIVEDVRQLLSGGVTVVGQAPPEVAAPLGMTGGAVDTVKARNPPVRVQERKVFSDVGRFG